MKKLLDKKRDLAFLRRIYKRENETAEKPISAHTGGKTPTGTGAKRSAIGEKHETGKEHTGTYLRAGRMVFIALRHSFVGHERAVARGKTMRFPHRFPTGSGQNYLQ